MTGRGKIARLPLSIRNQLNERLQNGEEGKELIRWLNGLRIVTEVLEEKFGGRPISQQNLSEWKQRGYQDWCRREENRALLREVLDEAGELEEEVGEISLTDRLTERVGLTLALLLRAELKEHETNPKHRTAALEIVREIARLREGDHEMERLRLLSDRWEIDRARLLEEDRKREIEDFRDRTTGRIVSALYRPQLVKAFGGGELGEKVAAIFDKMDSLSASSPGAESPRTAASLSSEAAGTPEDQTKSKLIKPSPSSEKNA